MLQKKKFGEELKLELTSTDLISGPGHKLAFPEELVNKFGRNKFDLIVSSAGELCYSKVNFKLGIINVIETLKKGEIANIYVIRLSNLERGILKGIDPTQVPDVAFHPISEIEKIKKMYSKDELSLLSVQKFDFKPENPGIQELMIRIVK